MTRAGGMPFFEALVGRFYAGVADDPVLRPLYPGGGPRARAAPADAVPRPVLGRPADLRRRARPSAAADAPLPVRHRRRRARPLARAHARGASPRSRRRADVAARAGALLRDGRRGDAQPRLTGPAALGRSGPAERPSGGPVHWCRRRSRASGGRHWRTTRRRRRRPRSGPRQDGPRRGGQRRPPRPRPGRRRGRGVPRDRAQGARPRIAPRTTARRRHDHGARTGRRPRLRQPVRPAHRSPRPRARRLLRAAAARHAVRGAGAARDAGDHPLRRPELGLRRRRAQARPGDLGRTDPGPRHLLRRPAHGPRARRRRPAGRQARVRAGQRHDHAPATACSTASSRTSRSG